ncbi:MAG: hypothetical protein Q7K55_01280 [Candidatus Levybacteria bacterium]|nr:hypothetical protein [Candidatus Levybacteria bacterium]
MDNENNAPLLHGFDQMNKSSVFSTKLVVFLLVAVLLGVGTGYLLSKNSSKTTLITTGSSGGSSVSKGTVVGSDDLKTFKDTTDGILKEGGIEGEGQYHLVRPGGDSQNVYLTSSIVDLSKFIDKKIKVWGETNTAKKAGWLMDVGRVEVL